MSTIPASIDNMTTHHPKELLRASEVGAHFGVTGGTIRDWTRAGVITPTLITPGGHYRYSVEDVREQLAARHPAPHDTPTSRIEPDEGEDG